MTARKQTVGTKLNALREKAGLSLGQLAEASGVNKVTIMRLEKDEFTRPNADKLIPLAKALGVDPAELLSAAGYAPKEALPSFKGYMRAKYAGQLTTEQIKKLGDVFDEITAENGPDTKQPKPRRTKGGA